MKQIALVGIGNLGRRHLQSLLNIQDKKMIYGIEPNDVTREQLKEEFSSQPEVDFFSSCDFLPEEIDLAVIATNSNVRRMVYEQLVQKVKVKNIIFEKVLFQKIEDYYIVSESLKRNSINAWVNCARREWPGYIELKDLLKEKEMINFSAIGGQWGMACNGIHMLDLMAYLSGDVVEYMDVSGLEPKVIESKRKGYFEVTGMITGKGKRCDSFQLICVEDSTLPIYINIVFKDTILTILEGKDIYTISSSENGWIAEEHKLNMRYQSQLTSVVAEQIFSSGQCHLPEYHLAMEEHLIFIRELTRFFEKQGMERELCPIT